MKSHATKALVGALAMTLFATSCFGGGGGGVDPNRSASDVKAPDELDPERNGLPGLFIVTNSASIRRLAKSPEGEGAVILFVEPGGPSDGLGIGRGDLITEVAGQKVMNHPRALTLMHDRPGKKIDVKIKHRDGRERTVTIEPREPLVASLRQYLNPLVAASPRDPIFRFLRAQTPGVLSGRLNDISVALDIDGRFVEALSLRAGLIWDNRPNDQEQVSRFVDEALDAWNKAIQIDAESTTALTTRSTALAVLGSAQQARRDAAKAIEVDPTYPRAYYALAIAEQALKRTQRAAAPARSAVELDPFNVPYWRLLAQIFVILKRKEDCQKTADAFAPFLEAQNFDQDADRLKRICR